jgi:amino acid adenylation domain-containing protein
MPFVGTQALFESQVERTPDAVAVAGVDGTLSYRVLNDSANQLAGALIELGVGPEVLVGVCMRRSPELLIALLGVLKAGGAYLPLDPEYPVARLSFMLEDAGAPVLLTHAPLLDSLPGHEAKVICVDRQQLAQAGPCDNPPQRTEPDSLAYLMYTSGSTGQPKGILVPQRGLVNYLTWCLAAYPVSTGSGAPVHSSIAFDLTVTSLFVPLLAGRTVYLLPHGNAIDLLREAFRARADFSFVKLTPAHLEVLGQVLEPHEAAGRTAAFIIGGENLTDRHVAFWQEFAPGTLLVNEYGPTETVVGCCVAFLPRGRSPAGSVPIGRPIAQTQLYVLDAAGRQVPPGAAGELYVGGAGVARGYHNRPDLTAERFVPDPFGSEPGARLYRTGDLVRARPDGALEFLERVDGQVKVRGFRVETAEVEENLEKHPAVQRAVVVAREDDPGEVRLVGYVVPRPGARPVAADLRAFLRERLPSFMVPSDLVSLDTLPLTPNGKVDRRALPAPDRLRAAHGGQPVAFDDAAAARMAGLWEEVLGTRPITADDNFFDLGGDSLQAVRLFQLIRTVFGRDLPVASLLQAPTVSELVRQLGAPERPDVVSLVPLRLGGACLPFFCFPGAGGDVLAFAELAELLGPDQPVHGIQVHLPAGPQGCPKSLEELAAHCLAQIRSTRREGPYLLGGFSFGATLAFETARQLLAQGQTVGLLAVFDQLACSPQRERRPQPVWSEVLKNLPRWARHDLSRLSPAYLLAWLRRRLTRLVRRAASPVPPAVADPPARLMDYELRLQGDYAPGPYAGRVHLLRAASQQARPLVSALLSGRDLGWGCLARGGVDVTVVPGWHNSILKKPDVVVLAAQLRRCLEQAHAATPARPAAADPRPQAEQVIETPAPGANATVVWRVVANGEEQYSVWPDDQPCPAGWHAAGPSGPRDACLAYIRTTWSDLRPQRIRGGASNGAVAHALRSEAAPGV